MNVQLQGPTGTGKTYSLKTLAEAGVETFLLSLESGAEAFFGAWTDYGKQIPDNVHWHILKGPTASFAEQLDSAKKINTLSFEGLTKITDPNRGKYNQFMSLLEVLNNFLDDRTGKTFGAVDSWGTGRALAIDGLTGICRAALSLVVGGKPVRSQADWGIAQNVVEELLRKLCDSCRCHFILISHVERETDAVLGGSKIMASALGKALAPKIPPMFSDVILAVREGAAFTWDTANPSADLKTRNLPIKAGIPPDFGQIIRKWQSRGGKLS